jgi:4-hydroxy-3-methylbut-2-enyl diphosphate reductase
MTHTALPAMRLQLRRAMVAGHGSETREALARLETRLKRGPVTVLGPLAPDVALCELFRRRGALEGDPLEFRSPTHTVVVPLCGLPRETRKRWKESGHELFDLTLPSVRRAQTSLNLLTLEHSKPLVAGFRDDAESAAIAGEAKGSTVVEDAEEASLLPFAPKFGIVCQTRISRRHASLIAEALRLRHPDSRMAFLDTTSLAMLERERSVEGLSRWAESIIVAGDAKEASVRALIETARRLGLPATAVADAGALDPREFSGIGRIGLTAGEFSPDAVIEAIAARLETEGGARSAS